MEIILRNSNLNQLPDFKRKKCSNFDCSENHLTNLIGSPTKLSGKFSCNDNLLLNLVGGPDRVELGYNCSANRLTSLLGAPKFVGSNFRCNVNPNLLDVSDLWPAFIRDYVIFSMNENMALLPLVKFKIIAMVDNYGIEQMFDKHRGSSKQNIIDLQYDLIENGFEKNARWKPIL